MSQLVKKFLGDNQVGALKARLENNSFLRGRNAADSADVNIIKVNASNVPEFGVQPQYSGSNLATESFVTSAVSAVALPYFLQPVRVATLANINLSTIGLGTVDGVTVSSGDRVLVRKQTTTSQNGIYVASAGTWTRSVDFDQNVETSKAAAIYVLQGTALAKTRWYIDPVAVIDTDPVSVALDGYRTNTQAITLTGTDITNQYVDLASITDNKSIILMVNGVMQRWGADFTVDDQSSSITRVSFAGDLATGGGAALVSGDVLYFMYRY